MGIARAGAVIRGRDPLAILGSTPKGIAANGIVIWRQRIEWEEYLQPVNAFNGICYANGQFVAVNAISAAVSQNGIDWTFYDSPAAPDAPSFLPNTFDITHGNGLFITLSQQGSGVASASRTIHTSDDLPTWTHRISWARSQGSAQRLIYDGGIFIVVRMPLALNATTNWLTSFDGITWTGRGGNATSPGSGFRSVAYGNGLFVSIGTTLSTSSDAITWTPPQSLTPLIGNTNWTDITYGDGLFVSVASSGTPCVMTSLNGTDWTARAAPDGTWISVAYGNGWFVAVANSGTQQVMTSRNGVNWHLEALSITPASNMRRVAYLNNRFIITAVDRILMLYL